MSQQSVEITELAVSSTVRVALIGDQLVNTTTTMETVNVMNVSRNTYENMEMYNGKNSSQR